MYYDRRERFYFPVAADELAFLSLDGKVGRIFNRLFRSKGLSKDPLQKLAAIHSKPASPRKLGMARVSALRRQSPQPVVKLAAATVNRRVVGSSPA